MQRVISLFSLLVVLALAACQSEPTQPTSPAVKPDLSIQSIDCAGVPNGGVVLIVSTPTLTVSSLVPFGVTHADVYRDDPNTPGIQVYCQDFNAAVTFTYTAPLVFRKHIIGQYAQASTGLRNSAGSAKVIASIGSVADTTLVTSN
jgi:hypothetical protein